MSVCGFTVRSQDILVHGLFQPDVQGSAHCITWLSPQVLHVAAGSCEGNTWRRSRRSTHESSQKWTFVFLNSDSNMKTNDVWYQNMFFFKLFLSCWEDPDVQQASSWLLLDFRLGLFLHVKYVRCFVSWMGQFLRDVGTEWQLCQWWSQFLDWYGLFTHLAPVWRLLPWNFPVNPFTEMVVYRETEAYLERNVSPQ